MVAASAISTISEQQLPTAGSISRSAAVVSMCLTSSLWWSTIAATGAPPTASVTPGRHTLWSVRATVRLSAPRHEAAPPPRSSRCSSSAGAPASSRLAQCPKSSEASCRSRSAESGSGTGMELLLGLWLERLLGERVRARVRVDS